MRFIAILFLPFFVAGQTAKPDSAYSKIVNAKTTTSAGFFKVHKSEGRWYFEVPDSLMGRELLAVGRIAKAAAGSRTGMMGYAGDEINENTIAFAKGPGNKIFLNTISHSEMSHDSSADGMYHAVMSSNLQPIAAAFDIKAVSPDSSASLIDVTDWLNGDNDVLFFDGGIKKMFGLNSLLADRSYTESIRAFASNIEIHSVKTFVKVLQPPIGQGVPEPATFELSSSIVLLPKAAMRPRYYDDRVGYFATEYTDFDANPHGVELTAMATRWRLEPKNPAAYLRGELCEPVKPILFYIDPATPKKWVPFLIRGVEDWNTAFEQAGFKNAIIAREAPVNDSAWDIDDAAHSAIVYEPSVIPNASGPNVHDPRSGEIIETHINWYHNVMELLHNWYFIQAAAVDPRGRKPHFGDSLMGQLIRFVVSHEVGHTLGLRHNFGASSTVPVDSLRSNNFLSLNGHTPSIMDYARFDYVAQPEDHISEANLFPRIGAYDKWAIEWGYRWFPDQETREQERARLNQWLIKKTKDNPALWFGTESDPNDPRCQNEDLGDDAMRAGVYGIKNLQRILPHLAEWTCEPAKDYEGLKDMYGELLGQFRRYMGHAAKNIGGIMTDPKTADQKGAVIWFVPKEKQQEAMRFLQQQLFTTPIWLLDKNIFSLTGTSNPSNILGAQSAILNQLLKPSTIQNLILYKAGEPANEYGFDDMLADLEKGIWSELHSHKPIDLFRRNLQKGYVEKIVALLNPILPSAGQQPTPGINKTDDGMSILRAHAKELATKIKAALPYQEQKETRWHLEDCSQRLKDAMEPKK